MPAYLRLANGWRCWFVDAHLVLQSLIAPSSLAESRRIIAEDMKGDKIYKPEGGLKT
jgi:hypothetical protein